LIETRWKILSVANLSVGLGLGQSGSEKKRAGYENDHSGNRESGFHGVPFGQGDVRILAGRKEIVFYAFSWSGRFFETC
jgi:hypothetical protein